MSQEIQQLQMEIYEKTKRLIELQKEAEAQPVEDYTFWTSDGETSLSQLFGSRERLLVIHNMGEKCRYCTLWADGFNGLLPHLEDAMGVVLVSGDEPETQRVFANSRGWRFRLASHKKGDYIREQSVMVGAENYPGAVLYTKKDGKIYRKNACVFGPGDLYCALWPLLGLAGLTEADWTPQFRYWQRPTALADGGADVLPESREN